MGLFDTLIDVATMPIRVGVDVVKLPKKIIEGEDDLLENIRKCLEKIEKDLNN